MQIRALTTQSEAETLSVAYAFAAQLHAGDVVLFFGDLGAGKTTFIRGMMQHFDASLQITSPTFALVNVYPTQPRVYHFDLYRIGGDSDLIDVGFEECLESDGIVLVEWAEKCGAMTPPRRWEVRLAVVDETRRAIEIERIDNDHPRD